MRRELEKTHLGPQTRRLAPYLSSLPSIPLPVVYFVDYKSKCIKMLISIEKHEEKTKKDPPRAQS